MSFFAGYKCDECGEITPSITMHCDPTGEHFTKFVTNLGAWIYKHSHCEQQWSPEATFTRVTEAMPEWVGSPMEWPKGLITSPCADGDFCKVVNGRIKHDRWCNDINHSDKD